MADETKRLKAGVTEKLEVKPEKAFPIFFSEGQIVKDRYKVISVLGQRGGESLIYLCEDTRKNAKVVLKLYHLGFTPKEEIVKKLAEVTHPDIINVLDYGYLDNNQFYEIMDYAEGGTLFERLGEKPFSEEELTRHVIPESLSGLKFCHENGIIHRDIKPENIFYKDRAREDIVIGDFGISSVLEHSVSVRKTKGALTLDYAAPELFGWKGEVYVGKEADYYAFGITLLHLFTGISPFVGQTEAQICHQHTSERIPLPDGISDKFKKLLCGLLVKERKKRWGASQIERWLRGEDVPVYEDELKVSPSIIPYKFTANAIAKTPKELAMLIQTLEDREVVRRHFSKGWYSNWLSNFDQELAFKVAEVEEKLKDVDSALLEISYILDPEMPYVLIPGEKPAETPEELATLIDKNWNVGKKHIFLGEVSTWLKYSGYHDIYERLEKIRKEFSKEQDIGVEVFLQILGLTPPEIITNTSNIRRSVESIGEYQVKEIKLTHKGNRGYLYGEIKFSENVEGISFSESNPDVIKVNLWPGESIEFILNIKAEKLQVGRSYEFSIVTKTNVATEINIPVSLFIDYPAYSKKSARNPFKIDG